MSKKEPKRKTTYLGGEWDRPAEVTPRVYEHFLTKRWLFGVLGLLVLFAAVVMVWGVLA